MKLYLVRAVYCIGEQPCFFDAFFLSQEKANLAFATLEASWQNDGGLISCTHDRGVFSIDTSYVQGVVLQEVQQQANIDPGFFR